MTRGDDVQLVVDERDEPVQCLPASLLPVAQELSDLCR
jgi:hypothetical protein